MSSLTETRLVFRDRTCEPGFFSSIEVFLKKFLERCNVFEDIHNWCTKTIVLRSSKHIPGVEKYYSSADQYEPEMPNFLKLVESILSFSYETCMTEMTTSWNTDIVCQARWERQRNTYTDYYQVSKFTTRNAGKERILFDGGEI